MSTKENPFPYYVGVDSLEQLANKDSRVCVMNIMGGESSTVTPVSHTYSGGNVVAGVQYGRGGSEMETEMGNIPVFGSIKEVVSSGIKFDTGVIYLPPTAVNHAVSELCANNPHLEKIIILTEKISVSDAKMIRWGCQQRKVDVYGANCLGIANPWDQVRLGGALGGDKPLESLKKGSVAIYSNSGNFTTTISEYLKTAGFGTSTLLSSGKDIYIHFAMAEFLRCAQNDDRTKAVVVYVEPGGYYEKQALDWIAEGLYEFDKPIIACVTGRWKASISRACGHAGAVGGSGDDALAKEKWFDEYFGVGVFDPANPKVSKKGVRITSIQEVPTALAAVAELIGQKPDFEPIGDLSLKPWFQNHMGVTYPPNLNYKLVEAISPYDEQIEKVSRQVGAQLPKENMRNRSGASFMNRKTQVTELYGVPLLDLVEKPFAATNIFALTKQFPNHAEQTLANVLMNSFVSIATSDVASSQAGRANHATPNAYIASQVLAAGNNDLMQGLKTNMAALIDLFYVNIGQDVSSNAEAVTKAMGENIAMAQGEGNKVIADHILATIKDQSLATVFSQYAEQKIAADSSVNAMALALAAAMLTLSWDSLTGRRITRRTCEDMGSYLSIHGIMVASAPAVPANNAQFQALANLSDASVLSQDFSETCFKILFAREGKEKEYFALNSMLNLTVTNGPGTISGKGAKESVSAKNNISVAYAGFMCNTGIAHGGNGFEAVAFLMDQFKDFNPYTASQAEQDETMKKLAHKAAADWGEYKKKAKIEGNMNYTKIPCVNHPVFKDKPKNIDPREEFIWGLFEEKKMVNPFQVFYHHLVEELYNVGATKNIFCVNIDAVIATISLELFWDDWKAGKVQSGEMQDIVFIMFLFARMVGSAAEVSDHLSRGTDMDCRTPASQCDFVV